VIVVRISLVTPYPPRSQHGNAVTATRWADIFGALGHRVEVAQRYLGQPADLLVALHARRSADSVRAFRSAHHHSPIVLALTGTDLYPELFATDLPVLRLVDRLVVLQPAGIEQLPAELRERARVIYQSVPTPAAGHPSATNRFDVVLLAHLREVKDPLLASAAARLLPARSHIRIRHAGAAMDARLAERAIRESQDNPRYHWLGELPRPRALRLLAEGRLAILTSRHEGGANAISEALAAAVPILASRIPGTIGILGRDYPGYFPPGDAAGLAAVLARAEADAGYYADLRHRCALVRPLVAPERERASWRALLAELTGQ
jgi:putative glycosyltransferase (TIGR04348 family)